MGIFGGKSKLGKDVVVSANDSTEIVVLSFKDNESPKRLKYRLSETKEQVFHAFGSFLGYRIEALVDLPLHGVKAGDMGGLVNTEHVLSHEDSCWIGEDAMVAYPRERWNHSSSGSSKNFSVTGDALVTGNAYVTGRVSGKSRISGNAYVLADLKGDSIISDNAYVSDCNVSGSIVISNNAKVVNMYIYNYGKNPVTIGGDIQLCSKGDRQHIRCDGDNKVSLAGSSRMNNVSITGSLVFDADVNLEDVTFDGDTTILGKPRIKPNVKFTGRNVISGDSLIPPGSHVHDVIMDYGVLQYGTPQMALPASEAQVMQLEQGATNITTGSLAVGVEQIDITEYLEIIEQIESEYETYTTDIVKLIKYPGMVDPSIPEVGDFVVKLRSAKRSLKTGSAERVKDMAESLESAFVRAESKVRTLVASHLDEGRKKSLKTAEKMFSIACDDASPEPEKRLGYKAGMRSLEGVIEVSDKAVENMKSRIGILELEA